MTMPADQPGDRSTQQLLAQPKFSRLAPSTLRSAWWAVRALRRARRDLRTTGLQTRVAPPPALPWGSRTGVSGVLRRLDPTCLEGAMVLQAWLQAHGVRREILVGVAASSNKDVRAHAWLEGADAAEEYEGYRVIHRISPQ